MNAQPTLNIQDMIDEYITLRNWKEEQEKKFEEDLKTKVGKRMKEIEGVVHRFLNDNGNRTCGIPGQGVAYMQRVVSCRTADMQAWRDFVITSGKFDMTEMKPHKPTITELVDAGGEVPPGINWTATDIVRFRKD